jgi:predicted kinase
MVACIVISGPPCAGKSTLAATVAARRGWPLLAKDDYKVSVFERLGVGDREWSRRVSALAWDLLLAEARRLLAAEIDCVLEGNFREPQRQALAMLPLPAPPRFVEIRCGARPDVLLSRYRARADAGSRHPGHVDLEALPDVEREIGAGTAAGVPLGGAPLVWDTSAGFASGALLAALDAVLAGPSAPASDIRS